MQLIAHLVDQKHCRYLLLAALGGYQYWALPPSEVHSLLGLELPLEVVAHSLVSLSVGAVESCGVCLLLLAVGSMCYSAVACYLAAFFVSLRQHLVSHPL